MLKNKSLNDLLIPVKSELSQTVNSLYSILSSDSEELNGIVSYTIESGGKHLRPALSLLASKLFIDTIEEKYIRLAQVTEIIHTASLLHDDVIDRSDLRRGNKTVSALWSNKFSVIAGDYFLAKASFLLGSLDNLELVKIFSEVLQGLCLGEVQQSELAYNPNISWDDYILKSKRKTAILFSCACFGPAIISGAPSRQIEALKDFGLNFGLAFQIIDDLLNFYTDDQVGKPSCQDLREGTITAPVIYAIEEFPEIKKCIETEFEEEETVLKVVELVKSSQGIVKTKQLAESYVNKAINSLDIFEDSEIKTHLIELAYYVIQREF